MASIVLEHRHTAHVTYPVFGEKEESNVNFSPLASWGRESSIRVQWRECNSYLIKCSSVLRVSYLVLQSDLCAQSVVGVPLLSEGQAVFCPLVLGLQRSCYLAGLCVSRARALELLQHQENKYGTLHLECNIFVTFSNFEFSNFEFLNFKFFNFNFFFQISNFWISNFWIKKKKKKIFWIFLFLNLENLKLIMKNGYLQSKGHWVRNCISLKNECELTLCQSRLHTASETFVRHKKNNIEFDFLCFTHL